jgi:hypothetical protein
MRRLRPELLQWYGLFGAALAWAGQFVVGFGVVSAECGAASSRFGVDVVTWVIVLALVGGTLAVLAELAAIDVLLATRNVEYGGPPPQGRRHFFAFAAALGNVLFLVAIILNAVGVLANTACRPA